MCEIFMEICDSMCLTLCLYYLTSRETRLHILNQNPLKISYELTITRKVVIFSSANSSLGGRHFRYCKLMPKCVQPRNLNKRIDIKRPDDWWESLAMSRIQPYHQMNSSFFLSKRPYHTNSATEGRLVMATYFNTA